MVCQELKKSFPKGRSRVRAYGDQLFVNFEIQSKQKNIKIAVQVCYHRNYLLSHPDHLIGGVQSELQMLESLGWRVVELNWEKWQNNKKYLQQILLQLFTILNQ
eukprot:TRINITY_DN51740_c0_g1_i1.p1 TRINITY_DN51740_c0_g1~~TRINITY_DN51740_c0_g1_i1.p1  ORF type:complete len:104 (+),score=11.48 TRINITY_DN51740_c0_g1_i1:96-407(+)